MTPRSRARRIRTPRQPMRPPRPLRGRRAEGVPLPCRAFVSLLPRAHAQAVALLGGVEVQPPGMVEASRWRASRRIDAGNADFPAAAAMSGGARRDYIPFGGRNGSRTAVERAVPACASRHRGAGRPDPRLRVNARRSAAAPCAHSGLGRGVRQGDAGPATRTPPGTCASGGRPGTSPLGAPSPHGAERRSQPPSRHGVGADQ